MATGYKNDQDEKQAADERYNPSDSARDLYNQENDAIDGYDRENDGLDNHPINDGDASGKSGDKGENPGKNINDAKDAEENPMNFTGSGDKKQSFDLKGMTKKKGPLALMIAIFGGGAFTIGGMFTGVLAPFAFAENVTDDLNDQLAALDIRSEAMLRAKVPRADVKESIAGCTKLSIRCKFKTMSRKQVLKYERAGITISKFEKAGMLGNRIAPTEFTFRGQAMSAQEFTSQLKTNPQLRVAYKRALNMKFLGLNDNSFLNRTLKRFGISKRPPELKGTHQERVNALMNRAGTDDVGKVTFVPAVDEDGNEKTDPRTGEKLYNLQGDASKREYTESQKTSSEQSIAKTTKPPSRAAGNILKGVSVVGYWDLACTIKNMVGGAAIAAKIAHQYQLAQYAMPVIALASMAKAGDISAEDGQVLGEFFGKTDERETIPDLENSVTTNEETKEITPNATIAMKPNPNHGKNVMDSPLYLLSSSNGLNNTSSVEAQYSLGMGQSVLLAGFAGAAAIMNEIGKVSGCEFVQNWAVRGVGLIVGVVAAFFSGGTSLAVNGAISGGLIAASIILEAIINNALSGSILSGDMDKAPTDRAAALWTGMASILATSAQNRGMIPANAAQLKAYNNLQIDSKNDYIAVEKADANPLDITNQYSFLGSLGRSLLPYFNAVESPQTAFGSVMSFTSNSLGQAVMPLNTYASVTHPDRFTKCDDEGYKKMHLAADVQCNLRYVMPTEELGYEVNTVAEYMETEGYVEADTTTGLPVGYIPPEPAQSQGFAMDMLNGVVNTFYNTRNYGDTDKGKEYGKFLDYCAYRIMPFGETYEEAGQINGVDRRWITGERCLDHDQMIKNFRIYTFDKTVSEAEDEDAIIVPTNSGSNPGGTPPIPGSSTGTVNPNGWAFPTFAGAPLNQPFHSGHLALDIGSEPDKPGVPIYAMRDGIVTSVGNMPMPPYVKACDGPSGTVQQTVVIEHVVDGQKYISTYHHVRAGLFNVQVGSVVKAGDQIAQMGNTGCSFGQHLHVELWRDRIWGTAIDLGPILYG